MEWLKDGVKNTSFFHAKATIRDQVNKIIGLRDASGSWTEDKQQMEAVVDSYFPSLFSSTNPEDGEIREVLQSLEPRLSEEDTIALSHPFTEQAVKDALSSMSPMKSPGRMVIWLSFTKNIGIF